MFENRDVVFTCEFIRSGKLSGENPFKEKRDVLSPADDKPKQKEGFSLMSTLPHEPKIIQLELELYPMTEVDFLKLELESLKKSHRAVRRAFFKKLGDLEKIFNEIKQGCENG